MLRGARRLVGRLARPLLGTLREVETDEPAVALTFDDGPHPSFTPMLLDVLARHGARATFFVVGESVAACPDVLSRLRRDGHCVANHSWDHPVFTRIGWAERTRQVLRTQRALGRRGTRLLRPPWGVQTLRTRIEAALLGFRTVAWSAAPSDWMRRSVAQLAKDMDDVLKPGSIVLLHDAVFRAHDSGAAEPDRSVMIAALDSVLARRTDLRFVTVPELMRAGRPVLVDWRFAEDWMPPGVYADGEPPCSSTDLTSDAD